MPTARQALAEIPVLPGRHGLLDRRIGGGVKAAHTHAPRAPDGQDAVPVGVTADATAARFSAPAPACINAATDHGDFALELIEQCAQALLPSADFKAQHAGTILGIHGKFLTARS